SIVTAGVLIATVILVALTASLPRVFGVPVLVIGCVLTPIGLGWLFFALHGWEPGLHWFLGWWWFAADADWEEIRWPLLILLVGAMPLTAYGACVMAARP